MESTLLRLVLCLVGGRHDQLVPLNLEVEVGRLKTRGLGANSNGVVALLHVKTPMPVWSGSLPGNRPATQESVKQPVKLLAHAVERLPAGRRRQGAAAMMDRAHFRTFGRPI